MKIDVVDAEPGLLMPYGRLLGAGAGVLDRDSAFYDGAVRTSRPVHFVSDDQTCLSLAAVQPRPMEVRYLERHHKHSQTFIPLDGKPFIAVFGAPTEGPLPDLASVRAFRFSGADGFCMHIGTWHEFPFAVAEETHLVVILREETNRDLQQIEGDEAHGADLDKVSIVRRFGAPLQIGRPG